VPKINPESLRRIEPRLSPGETVLWADQPNRHVIFHAEDATLIPFSLLWGGFAIFWEAGVTGYLPIFTVPSPWWYRLWGIPFVLIGQYLIWGRFLHAAWLKTRTHYAVTTLRVMAVQDGWNRRFAFEFLDSFERPILVSCQNGRGTLRVRPKPPLNSKKWRWSGWNPVFVEESPVFVDIDGVESVFRLIQDARARVLATART
jgi:hypothetical protein